MTTAPTGSTMFCSSCGPSGTRSGLSSNGGAMSTPVTALPASAMRIVRVMLRTGGDGRESRGRDMARDDRALTGRGAAGVGEKLREAGELGVGVDRIARRAELRVEIGRADRQADQRNAIGRMQHVGAAPDAAPSAADATAARQQATPMRDRGVIGSKLRVRNVSADWTAITQKFRRRCANSEATRVKQKSPRSPLSRPCGLAAERTITSSPWSRRSSPFARASPATKATSPRCTTPRGARPIAASFRGASSSA